MLRLIDSATAMPSSRPQPAGVRVRVYLPPGQVRAAGAVPGPAGAPAAGRRLASAAWQALPPLLAASPALGSVAPVQNRPTLAPLLPTRPPGPPPQVLGYLEQMLANSEASRAKAKSRQRATENADYAAAEQYWYSMASDIGSDRCAAGGGAAARVAAAAGWLAGRLAGESLRCWWGPGGAAAPPRPAQLLWQRSLAVLTPPAAPDPRWDVVKGFKKKGADSIRGVYQMVAARKLKALDLRAQAPALYKYLNEEQAGA